MVTDEVRTEPETAPAEIPAARVAPEAQSEPPPVGDPVVTKDEPVQSSRTALEAVAVAEAAVAVVTVEPPNNKHWYVVKVQSGREDTIKDAIERKVKIERLEEYYGQIYIPTEKITEMRNGKRYTRSRKKLPGYIMAEVEFNDRILYLFRETSGVGDFVGGTNNKPPQPMSPHEVARWLAPPDQTPAEGVTAAVKHDFEKGDRVRVKDGMFKDMEGEVKDIVEEKNQAKVEVSIFGRPVIIDVEYWQVERV